MCIYWEVVFQKGYRSFIASVNISAQFSLPLSILGIAVF